MNSILNANVNEMAGRSFECNCGKRHSIGIQSIALGKGALDELLDIMKIYHQGKIFLIADNHTYEACGRSVENLLEMEQIDFYKYIFSGKHSLIPDESAIGRLLIEFDQSTSLIVAVGSGTINDLARIISYKLNAPYIIVCTAPSVDGYASTVSPLIVEGRKVTYEAVYPYAIIADTDVLEKAPLEMLQAGFGDILGKYTALADWKLSHIINNEYYCETSVAMVQSALEKCTLSIDGVTQRDKKAIYTMMEALILSGIAMGLVGNSRPASGAEHHLAHYWEMDALARGVDHPLHGHSVGVGTVVIAHLYKMIKDKIPKSIEVPDPVWLQNLLEKIGACSNPSSLGIPRDVFRSSMIHAMKIRPRYTIFHLISDQGLLEEYADILTEKFYNNTAPLHLQK